MPSIKDFKNIQPSVSKKTSTGLWDMLDDFKTMITNNAEPETVNVLETPLSETTSLELDRNNNLKPSPLLETKHNTDIQKPGTKWAQSGRTTEHKVGTKPGTKGVQTGCSENQIGYKVGAQPGAKRGTNRVQTGYKVGANSCFSTLVGLQRSIIVFFYNECRTARSDKTKQLSIEYIIASLNSTYNSVKTTIKRLIKKGLINRIDFKNGRGGWSTYSISEHVFQELLCNENEYKVGANRVQTEYKVGPQPGSQPGTAVVVSSYINNNDKLLTTTALPEEFKALDISCLTNIGFDESHVIQIYREYTKKPELTLSPEIIQNSINAFSFDLKHNNISNDFKGSPTVVLTSLLKKGQPYSSKTPEKVLTPKEEAMQEYFLAQNKKQQKILELEIKTKELALQEWLNLLPEEELLNFNQDRRPEGMPEKLKQILSKVKQESKPQEQTPT